MARTIFPQPEDDRDRDIFGDIERVGWSVIQIEDGDEPGPVYSFTVGLFHTHDHPEIILFGLQAPIAGAIINDIGAAIADGARIETGRPYDDFTSVPVQFVAVDPAHYRAYVGYALWLYSGPTFPMLQCVWPLKSGLFPWDAGYPPQGASIQPLLSARTP
jgi:hypothetical protein